MSTCVIFLFDQVILWTVDRGSPKLNLTSLQAARIEVGVYTHDCQLVCTIMCSAALGSLIPLKTLWGEHLGTHIWAFRAHQGSGRPASERCCPNRSPTPLSNT